MRSCLGAFIAFVVCFLAGIGLVLGGVLAINKWFPPEHQAPQVYLNLD